jgi:hypothetical protein
MVAAAVEQRQLLKGLDMALISREELPEASIWSA